MRYKSVRRGITIGVLGLIVVSSIMASWLATAQQVLLEGWFHIIWYDGPQGSGIKGEIYVLIDDQGQEYRLQLDLKLTEPFGGVLALNYKRVKIVVEQAPGPLGQEPVRVLSIQLGEGVMAGVEPITGSQPWINLLCKFSDVATEPKPLSYFTGLMGNTYPGLDHYWREVSYNNINIVGSASQNWKTLPNPRSVYVSDRNGDGDTNDSGEADLTRLFNDCTAIHDVDVYFPNFVGINLMFNDLLDCCAWGGSRTATLDGVTKNYRVTWEPPWGYSNQQVLAHEMGHGFGLPHSSGPYNDTYDSLWDVMSGGGTCSPPHSTYGCIAPHTISHHKDMLGWIPSARKFVPPLNSSTTITIERLAQPVSSTNYLMAQIPIGSSTTRFYTVEVRRFVGYDNNVPGEAVVIHNVDTTRSCTGFTGGCRAQVVDATNNNNPNDGGAMWVPGETYTDTVNNIQIRVNSSATSSFSVTITRGSVVGPANDNFANAQVISGSSGTTTGSNVGATKESGEPNHAGNAGGASVWYRWTAPSSGTATIDTIGSNFDTLLAVYTGSAVNSLTLIASNDDIGGGNVQSRVTFTATSGTTYQIAVDGYGGATGNITLNWSLASACTATGAIFRIERATGNVCADGSFISGGADIAEYILASEAVEPGDVVELDPHNPGQYRKARTPYSHLVVGVISTNPGLILGLKLSEGLTLTPALSTIRERVELNLTLARLSEGTMLLSGVSISKLAKQTQRERPLLALLGRVPVKATTENGPIRVGDLLTSSSKPGYAMRCENTQKCEGAIIGKALEALEDEEGVIVMLLMR